LPDIQVTHIEGLRFRARSQDGFEVVMDAAPEHGGGEAGMTPMECVLAALGGCSGMDIAAILKNHHQELTGYEINISAKRAEEHPKVFTEITVEHVLRGPDLTPAAAQMAVESSTDKYCSVLAMLKETAVINVTWRIEASSRGAAE
jgi:putative redox protein